MAENREAWPNRLPLPSVRIAVLGLSSELEQSSEVRSRGGWGSSIPGMERGKEGTAPVTTFPAKEQPWSQEMPQARRGSAGADRKPESHPQPHTQFPDMAALSADSPTSHSLYSARWTLSSATAN